MSEHECEEDCELCSKDAWLASRDAEPEAMTAPKDQPDHKAQAREIVRKDFIAQYRAVWSSELRFCETT